MTVPADIREQVRQRAGFVCEFCGVSETDNGAQLTIDHFQPHSKGGSDEFGNLVYSCVRCNQYKQDYWPLQAGEPKLCNPRSGPFHQHFIELEDGCLHPLTASGAFTLQRLRLNRAPLILWRLRKRRQEEELRLLEHYRDLAQLLAELHRQKASLLEDQKKLLAEQQTLLRLLLGGN